MRTVIETVDQLDAELPTWYGQDFAIDIETTGLDYMRERVLGIALTFADGRSYYVVTEHTVPEEETVARTRLVDVPTGETEEYVHVTKGGNEKIKQRPLFATVEERYEEVVTAYPPRVFCPREAVATRLRALCAQDVVMVAHNAKFELHFLSRMGLPLRGRLADTMLAAKLIDENRRVGLKTLAPLVDMRLDHYADLEHYPGFPKEAILGVPLEATAHYAMDDTEATWRLWQRFRFELDEEGVAAAFTDNWMPLLPVLQEMEARGIAMDMTRVEEARVLYQAKADAAELAVWNEGMDMVLDRWKMADDWTELPNTYLKQLAEVAPEIPYAGQTSVTIRGRELPVFTKATSRAFRPRVPWFNAGSSAQLRELLFGWLGLEVPDDVQLNTTASGDVGVDKDTLKVIKYELGDDAPAALTHILDYRKAAKMLSTYFDTYRERTDPNDHHCIRTQFNQAEAATGRLSSEKPNLQNQPSRKEEGKLIRGLFVARPGHKLIVADYATMELRMAAHYSGDETMRRAFVDGLDLHTLTASTQQGIDYDELVNLLAAGDEEAKQWRAIGKTSNFGLLYGMGAKKFQRYLIVENDVKVTLSEAQALIDGFNATFEGATAWKREVEEWIARLGYVQTISGRKRRLPDIWSRERWLRMSAQRQGVNCVIQGSCMDVMGEVMPPIQSMLKGYGGSLLLQVHDELVAEAPADTAELCARLMEQMMVGLVNPRLRVPLVCEAGIGDSWGTAKH